jgi:hypothetical protein
MRSSLSRRGALKIMLAAGCGVASPERARAAPAEITVPGNLPVERVDFEASGIERWTTVAGQWAVEEMEGAPSGRRVLVQRATRNAYNVIVAPFGTYTDVEVSMRFKPISGREDASGGIVFRFAGGKYYVVRANALEDNFRLYFYDRDRRQLASAGVKAPALGQWHAVRVVAVGDHIQAWLDGTRYFDHRDSRFASGRVGLWTKADSVTAFDDLAIRGVGGGKSDGLPPRVLRRLPRSRRRPAGQCRVPSAEAKAHDTHSGDGLPRNDHAECGDDH